MLHLSPTHHLLGPDSDDNAASAVSLLILVKSRRFQFALHLHSACALWVPMRICSHVDGSLRPPPSRVVLVSLCFSGTTEKTRSDLRQEGLGEYVMSQSSACIAMEKQCYAQTAQRQPVVLMRGQDCRVWDADGKEYGDREPLCY